MNRLQQGFTNPYLESLPAGSSAPIEVQQEEPSEQAPSESEDSSFVPDWDEEVARRPVEELGREENRRLASPEVKSLALDGATSSFTTMAGGP